MASEGAELAHGLAWHHLTVRCVAEALGVDLQLGLSAEEAQARLGRHGPNRLSPRKRKPAVLRFLEQS